ncbi:MAG TPA: hypothetical protein VFY38_09545 [Pseudonocardia sp.]|nr:hypothetical protein [Pseudonocardia sp.]
MTTSEPRTPHDDTPREHRRLGQRIVDAVLGDPADARRDDPADTRHGDPERAAGRTGVEGFAGDGPRGDYASYEQATRDRPDGGVARDDRAAAQGYAAPTPEPGGMPTDALHDAGQAGHADRPDAVRDAGYDAGDTVSDARRDAGQSAYVDRDDALRDTGYDARPDAGQAGYADQRASDRADTTEAPGDSGYDQPGTRAGTAPDAAHDLPRPGAGTVGDDRDLVTSSYDPAQDTGYVDAGRAEADRTTGRRDDDLDTGRVDRDPGDRVLTESVDRDRDDTHRGVGAAAGAAGAGAVAATAFRDDTDRGLDRETGRDASFNAVDDTATVDSSGNGHSTAESAAAGVGIADEDGASDTRERLVPAERAEDYGSRWDALKGDFVDEPRRAVRQADELVGELLDELQRLFADQRHNLEQGFDHDQASTEDLRLALRRYRSFFDRLLSF